MNHYLHIEVLTPLHVGSGRTLGNNTEFLKFDEVVSVIDDHKILKIIGEENIEKWVDLIGNGGDLLAYLRQRSPAGKVEPGQTDKRLLPIVGDYLKPGNGLREQIFSGNGQPLLPGSSLKGAIRTAIVNALIEQQPYVAKKALESKEKKSNYSGKTTVKYRKFEPALVGKDPNHDSFRLLRIGDAHFDGTVCLLAQTLNQTNYDLTIKETVNQLVECIPAGAQALSGVSIPVDLLREIKKRPDVAREMKANDAVSDWDKVFRQINRFTQKRVEAELAKYDIPLPADAAAYPVMLKELHDQIAGLAARQCIVRVGFGTGYLNMTGGWPLEQWQKILPPDKYRQEMDNLAIAVRRTDQYNSFDLPKSRKVILGGVPMGYLKLTLWTAEQAEAWKGQAAQRQAELESQQAQAAEAARQQAEAEAEAERLAKEEARQPVLFTGTVKKNAEMDAEIVTSGKTNLVKLFIEGQNKEPVPMHGYLSPEPVGTVMIVTVNELTKKGRVLSVKYKNFK